MGLDVTAYRGLVRAVESETTVCFYRNEAFPGRADEIEDGTASDGPDDPGTGTHYTYGATHWFCAGSYSGYNRWRSALDALRGVDSAAFEELIWFSDCEGTIGTAVSAKLAADFAAYQPKADAHPDDYFRRKYAEWRHAFEMAADGGAVSFH